MSRLLLPLIAVVTACSPSSQDSSMHSPDPKTPAASPTPERAAVTEQPAAKVTTAAAPTAEPNPSPSSPAADAEGRRILSTAFVRVGPDGHLTVDLRDGRTLVLRDVTMGARDYCGAQVSPASSGSKFCGGYADVAGARPGGGPLPSEPASLDPLQAR